MYYYNGMDEKKDAAWGGHRNGSGRRKKSAEEIRGKTLSVCGSEYEVEKVKSDAREAGKTTSRYVFDELVIKRKK